jgi:hypothetical protein
MDRHSQAGFARSVSTYQARYGNAVHLAFFRPSFLRESNQKSVLRHCNQKILKPPGRNAFLGNWFYPPRPGRTSHLINPKEDTFMADQGTRGGSHEQHVKAGEQSHKSTSNGSHSGSHEQQTKAGEQSHKSTSGGSHSGSHEQQTKAGEQSHKSTSSGGTQGGTHEQHVKAGQQSHKNS